MAVRYGLGDVFVSPAEYQEKASDGSIGKFFSNLEKKKPVSIEFREGIITPESFQASERNFEKALIQVTKGNQKKQPKKELFAPIGIGKPLCVKIQTIYTGDVPSTFFRGPAGILVSSAVKVNIGSVDVSPRAINLLCEQVDDFQRLQLPSAVLFGTPIVYYSPSVVNDTTTIHLEFIGDKFKKPLINLVKGIAATALPIFVPVAHYLVIGSSIIDIAQNLVEALLPNKAFMQDDVVIQMTKDAGGLLPEFKPKNMFLCNDKDIKEFKDYTIQAVDDGSGNYQLALVNKDTKEEYRGRAPYTIATFEGKRISELENFSPTLVSAALLDQFYGNKPSEAAVKAINDAMKLYNDFSYSQEAEKLKAQIAKLPKKSQEYLAMKAKIDAYNSGIQDQRLKVTL